MATSHLPGASTPPDMHDSPDDLVYDGLRVQIEPAPFWPRALALAIDLGMIYLATIVLVIAAGILAVGAVTAGEAMGGAAAVLIAVIFLVGVMGVTHGYFIYYEYKKEGQTPGKKIMGLRVVMIDGSPLSLGKCILRESMRYVDVLLVLPGLLSFVLTQKRQRLGDLMTGAMVSYSRYDAQEAEYLYVKQSDYLYLKEILSPQPMSQDEMRDFLKFSYRTFILPRAKHDNDEEMEYWKDVACRFMPKAAEKELDRLTILLFFAEYCQQTLNHVKKS